MASDQCGCFYCLGVYAPTDIKEWIDELPDSPDSGTTAICPRCGVDSVIGSQSGYPITQELLKGMRTYWFWSSRSGDGAA